MSNNTNCKNIENCYYCDSCDFCDSCYYCDSCDFCYSCDSCNYCDSCYSSKGLRMSERMLFCLGEGISASKGTGYQKNNQIFNTQVTESEWSEARNSLPEIELQITKWVDKKDMTKEEKSNSSVWKEIGGYLKRYTYEEAWANWWEDASAKDRQAILDLPHFDGEIFTGITGITDFTTNKLKTVNIGGKEYKVTPELIKQVGNQFIYDTLKDITLKDILEAKGKLNE